MNVDESSHSWRKEEHELWYLGRGYVKIQKGLCDYSIDKRSKNGKR